MTERSWLGSLGLLILRVGLGCLMLFGHGWGKLTGFGEMAAGFADPIGLGPRISLIMAIFAEVFCSILIILGIGTRLAVIPLMVTMGVAALVVHADDPFDVKEKALLYLTGFTALLIAGGGAFSLGSLVWKKVRSKRETPA